MRLRRCAQAVIAIGGIALADNVRVAFPGCDAPAVEDPLQPSDLSWFDPHLGGGRMLDAVGSLEYGEPINVIVSGHSDPEILSHSGFKAYARSIGFSDECLGLHYGTIQTANLGDGLGWRGEQLLARQTFQTYFPLWGTTCWESFAGGNHFRAWRQNGSLANTGAWFLAVSKEMDSSKRHMIIEDGYDIGRDLLVARALAGGKVGLDEWTADVEWVQGLIEPGSKGINHVIPQDGLVAVLTVRRAAERRPWKSLWSLLRDLLPFLPA